MTAPGTDGPAPFVAPPKRPAPRQPAWLTFLAGMLTASALFAGVGFGIVSARDQAGASGPGAVDGPGTPVPNRPVPPAIVGRIVEVNAGQRQLLVRNRAGRFILVSLTANTVFRRGLQPIRVEEARGELRRSAPVLVLGRQTGDQLQALVVTFSPPGAQFPAAPNRPGILPRPNAQPSQAPR